MDIHLATTAILSAASGIGVGAVGGWFGQKRMRARAGRPVVNLDGEDIVIANTLNEDIFLVKIAATTQFALAFKRGGDDWQFNEVEHWFRRSRECKQKLSRIVTQDSSCWLSRSVNRYSFS